MLNTHTPPKPQPSWALRPANRIRRNFMTARRAPVLLAALTAALTLGATSAAPGSASLGPATALSNDVVQNLSTATLVGAVPSSQTVTVGIYLSNPNHAADD